MTNLPLSKDGVKNIDTTKDVFMPVLEIYPQGTLSSIQHLGIFEGNTDVFDLSKINEFIEIFAVQRNRDEGREFGFLQNMRPCTTNDFERHRYELDSGETIKINQKRYLCFDGNVGGQAEKVKFEVDDLYNSKNRKAFQINIATCNSRLRTCRNETQIRDFLGLFYFNMMVLSERTELGRVDTTDMLST